MNAIYDESALATGIPLRLSVAPSQSFVLGLLLFELLLANLSIVHLKEHPCRGHECLFYASACLSRRLKEAVQALLTSELLSLAGADLTLLLLIFLVGNQENQCIRLTLILNLLEPMC